MDSASADDVQESAPVAGFKRSKRKDLRGTWPQAILSLVGAIAMILGIRWAFFEPYVIPSGSMIPTLLIHDHILVNKFAYGVHIPFSTKWLVQFSSPKRGEVVVFRSVDDESVFLIKRVVGLPGDSVVVKANGVLEINGQPMQREVLKDAQVEALFKAWPKQDLDDLVNENEVANETLDTRKHFALLAKEREHVEQGPYAIPAGEYFMMGDNRDNSADSRVWGTLPFNHILGRASFIWLSCEETLQDSSQLCDPQTLRRERFFKGI